VRTVLIDADVLVYMAALRVEVETQWDESLWTLHSDLDDGIMELDGMVQEIQEGLGADRVIMALSDYDEPNWRLSVLPSYKQHRRGELKRRPIIWRPLREYIHETYETYQRPGLEGDDVLGILLTHPKVVKGEKICVSIDKDMNTLPGLHLNFDKARAAGDDLGDHVYEVSEAEADTFHMLQTIAGDAVDGYSGAPGWGMVRAERLLREGKVLEPHEHTFTRGARKGETETRWGPGGEGSLWEVALSSFLQAGLSKAVALQNARVARICRASDYNFKKKEVRLWEP
jgi:DNA polymerase-1